MFRLWTKVHNSFNLTLPACVVNLMLINVGHSHIHFVCIAKFCNIVYDTSQYTNILKDSYFVVYVVCVVLCSFQL